MLCEKPLAISSKETAELVKLAAARPKQAAGVNYNIRFYPLCQEMQTRVARGDLGRILSVSGSYTQDWLLLVDDYNWRVEPDGHTNLRAVSDIGTHWMDLAQFVTGLHIEEVNADLATFHPERKKPIGGAETFSGPGGKKATETVKIVTEDYGAVLLHLTGGARGTSSTSSDARRPQEPALPRGLRHRGLDGLGQRVARVPLDGPPRRAELAHEPRPVPCSRPRPARRAITPAATPRASPTPSSSSTWRSTASSPRAAPARRTSPPSPTATARSASARPSPTAPRSGTWAAVAD